MTRSTPEVHAGAVIDDGGTIEVKHAHACLVKNNTDGRKDAGSSTKHGGAIKKTARHKAALNFRCAVLSHHCRTRSSLTNTRDELRREKLVRFFVRSAGSSW
jgi:hypothetical protein